MQSWVADGLLIAGGLALAAAAITFSVQLGTFRAVW